MTYERIRYDVPADDVGRITLARADKRNAQDRKMLYELDAAFAEAMRDDAIKVVILAADGPDFSSGHDLSDRQPVTDFETVTQTGGFNEPGQHGMMAGEEEFYLGFCWRWRNLPKPTIAQVQGRVMAGGLMLVWPMDLVIASTDARFTDPVVALGVNGHEFFVHAWELGHRKAKEMLFRGGFLTAEECHRLGMINHVVELDELETLHAGGRVGDREASGVRAQAREALGQREPRRAGTVQRRPGSFRIAPSRACKQPDRSRHADRSVRSADHQRDRKGNESG